MKRPILILMLLFAVLQTKAQTFSEWFDQKKTQKKYLLEQIAALQVYIGYAQKGYKIARQGLDFIGDMKDGEFSLHKDYFSSLKTVNPQVKKYSKAQEILDLQEAIINDVSQTKKQLKDGAMLREKELIYVYQVYKRLSDDCAAILDQLDAVLRNGELEMKDDERIRRIDELHSQMQDNYTFCKHFGSEAKLLAADRKQELNEVQTGRAMSGIK